MRVLVTGANGFAGRNLCPRLHAEGYQIRVLLRAMPNYPQPMQDVVVADLTQPGEETRAAAGCDAVVHLAARAHVLREHASDPLTAFREVNRDATLRLARSAAEGGVRHFVFVSSIGVLGATSGNTIFNERSPVRPHSPYAVSKAEAEEGLWQLAGETGMGLTILRPPLIYGPRAPGNMRRLLKLVRTKMPLPLGAASAPKTFLSVHNLADAILASLRQPPGRPRSLVVADAEIISTRELVRQMAEGMGQRARLVPVPRRLIDLAARLARQHQAVSQLFEPLAVDAAAARRELAWNPPITTQEGVREMASAFKREPW